MFLRNIRRQPVSRRSCATIRPRRIFSEKLSGASADRPQLHAMLDYVREGIEIAKARGKYKGRKPTPIDWTKFGQLYGE